MTQPLPRECKLQGCAVRFVPPANARNKEFCCENHRRLWHESRRKAAAKLLAEVEETAEATGK